MSTRPRLLLVHSSEHTVQSSQYPTHDPVGAGELARALALASASGAEPRLLERRLLRQLRARPVPRHGPPTSYAEAMRRRFEDQRNE